MKPSKIKTIKGKKALFLPSNFKGITLFGTVYCQKKEDADELNKNEFVDSNFKNHELIHVRQAESTNDSWLLYYIRYIWEWICNLSLITISRNMPYKFMPMEMEAYLNQDNWSYSSKSAIQWKKFEKIPKKDLKEMAKDYYLNHRKNKTFSTFLKEKFGK